MNRQTAIRQALAALLLLLPMAGHSRQAPAPAAAPAGENDRLVSSSWLAAHLLDRGLVLLHVGDRAEYDAAHLPGARFVALRDLSLPTPTADDLRLQMLPAEELRQRLEALGISDDSRIVVYFGKDWVSPATRLLFTLDHAGLGARASLLDGGQPAWVRAGHGVTAEVPAPRTGKLQPLALRPSIVDASFVLEHRAKPGFVLIDARDADFYSGVETGGPPERPHRTGHIAGARSVPFDAIATADLHLRSEKELRELFTAAGVAPGDVVIAYCHIGQQATAVLFAARSLGHEVRLYDGSFEEWSRLPDHPVETSAAAAPPASAANAGEKAAP